MLHPLRFWLNSLVNPVRSGAGKQLTPSRRRGATRATDSRCCESLESRTVPATITVTSLADNTTTDSVVTLREAIQAANTDTSVDGSTAGSGADTIVFDPGLVSFADTTLAVSQSSNGSVGPTAFEITSVITIQGPAGNNVLNITRSSTSNFRMFSVASGGNLTLDSVTVSNGAAFGFTGGKGSTSGGASAGLGGGVFVQSGGTLTVRNSTLTGNVAQGGIATGYTTGEYQDGGGAGAGLGGAGSNSANHYGYSGGGPNGGSGQANGGPYAGGYGGGGGAGNASFTSSAASVATGGAGGFGGGGGGGGMNTVSNSSVTWQSTFTIGNGGNGGFGGGGGSGTIGGQGGFGAGDGETANNDSSGGNGAGMGGAIFSNGGTVTITNSTLTANSASGSTQTNNANNASTLQSSGLGGAVFARNGSLTILNSTISGNTVGGNTASRGRGVFVLGDAAAATAIFNNALIAQDDTDTTDVVVESINSGTTATSGAGNLIRSSSGLTGVTVASTAAPNLGPLAKNGGPTMTLGLRSGSPALDVGDNSVASALTTDQRGTGFARVLNGTVDIGAFEGLYYSPPVAQNNTVTIDEDTVLTFAVTDFPFTDPEGDALSSITVSGLTVPTGDALTVDQGSGPVAVVNMMTITAAQIPTLTYTPAQNVSGSARVTFRFTVNDARPGFGTVAATLTINVTQISDAPTALALSSTSINEGLPYGTPIGTFQTTDADPNDTFTYTLVQGTGDTMNWVVAISGNQILTGAVYDARYITTLPVRVRVTEASGLYLEQTFTITVTASQPATLYRAYNPTTDSHFYTTNQDEFNTAVSNGFVDESSGQNGFQILDASAPNASPVYRLYNIQTGQHYYTTNTNEKAFLLAIVPAPATGPDNRVIGWRDEGILGYIYTSQQPGTTLIYQLYNQITGAHLYTESAAARDAVLSIPGAPGMPNPWQLQTPLGYGYPLNSTPPNSPPATAAAIAPSAASSSPEIPAPTTATVPLGLLAQPGGANALEGPSLLTTPVFQAAASEETISRTAPLPTAVLDLALTDWTDTLTAGTL